MSKEFFKIQKQNKFNFLIIQSHLEPICNTKFEIFLRLVCNIFLLRKTIFKRKKVQKFTQMGVRGLSIYLMVISMMLVSSSSLAFADSIIQNKKIEFDESLTRPTFGLNHEKNYRAVDDGFKFNDHTFTITNNFHTPFREIPIDIGEVNSFEAKVFVEKKLKVQEFLFGIPIKGQAHLAELGVEVWYDLFGQIEDIKVIQKTNVIHSESVTAIHEKVKCKRTDYKKECDATKISMVFLEPLKDKVMAIKAIDYKNRYQITYLNDGFDVSGNSMNPQERVMIPSPVRNEGLIQLVQTEKYSPHWKAADGRTFEKNDFGSFKQVDMKFERFQDSGEPRDRLHSGFGDVVLSEQERAKAVFDASKLVSELPDSFAYVFPEPHERITDEILQIMYEEEQKCLKYLEEQDKQTRDY